MNNIAKINRKDDSKRVAMTNVDNAPMIFADKVPVYGIIGEVVTTTLAAERPVGEGIAIAATVHLRLTRDAAKVLATSLMSALAMLDERSPPRETIN